MKTTNKLLWILSAFYVVVAIVYTLWTIMHDGYLEWVGGVCFVLMAVFTAFIAFYLGVENKPFANRLLPEDRLDAEIADADPDLGFFAPQSHWPIILAAVAGAAILGVCFGWWPLFFFAPLVVVSIAGWSFEYYLGRLKH